MQFDSSKTACLFVKSPRVLSNFFAKTLKERLPVFNIDIKSSYKLLLCDKDLRSTNLWQWNDGLLDIFKNLYGNPFSLFVFIKRKNHCNMPFNDTYKMCCCHLF